MKLYKTTIKPLSSFATALKGDTLFGQLCWGIRFAFGEQRLNTLLADYLNKPFLVVSDAFLSGYLPKPLAPLEMLEKNTSEKKQIRKKIWLSLNDLQKGNFSSAIPESENSKKVEYSIKNSINRLTFTTGDDFAPFSEAETFFSSFLDIYFLLDEDRFTKAELVSALQSVAAVGYGKNASIGKGRFEFDELKSVELCKDLGGNTAFMTLSPSVLNGFSKVFYEPFTRFGKHGANLANEKPFKAPLLLADTKALIMPNNDEKSRILEFGYIGKGISGHSAYENSVHQGYAIAASTILKAQK